MPADTDSDQTSPAALAALDERVLQFRRASIDPHVAGWEADRQMAPPEVYRSAGEAGLLSMCVPEEHGGLGLSFEAKVRAFDIISETAMATAFSLINTHNIAERIAEGGTADQRDRWLAGLMDGSLVGCTAITEPGVGSDATAMTTTMTPAASTAPGDGLRIDGAKAWITNAPIADVVVAYVQTDPGSGAAGIAGVLIDTGRPGVRCSVTESMIGGHGIGAGTFEFDGYVAEAADVIAPAGQGFKTLIAGINGARTYVASMCCAMVRSSLATALDYGTDRHAFGSAVIDFQGLRWSLAEVANQLTAAQALVGRAVDAIDNGAPRDAVLPAAHAKKFATQMAEPAIAACIQSMGAAGLRDEYPLARHLAAARIASFTDGSTEMMTERIARTLPEDYPLP